MGVLYLTTVRLIIATHSSLDAFHCSSVVSGGQTDLSLIKLTYLV